MPNIKPDAPISRSSARFYLTELAYDSAVKKNDGNEKLSAVLFQVEGCSEDVTDEMEDGKNGCQIRKNC